MLRDRTHLILIPVAAAIAVFPLLLQGPSCGHDFTFHLLNWFEAAAQFRHGNLHPQWAISPAWNAGEPRFVFYPPLSWTFGALLGLILPWTWTPIVYTWLALTASGLTMHRLARAHLGPTPATFAASLYLANPYMLFTAYERTAYAELLAAAFIPLLFHAILGRRTTILAIALPLALLWLTNAPAAVMGTYALAFLALIRLATLKLRGADLPQPHRNGQSYSLPPSTRQDLNQPIFLAFTTAAGTLLGLSLAAFYLLPAALNRPLVQIAMVILPGMRVEDNTLFHHTGQTEDALAHDAVLYTASLIALVCLTATAAALLIAWFRDLSLPAPCQQARLEREKSHIPDKAVPGPIVTALVEGPATNISDARTHDLPRGQSLLLALTLITITIAFLLTPLSLPIWRHAPELAFLQFPWRLLAILGTALSLSSALALRSLQWKPLSTTLTSLTLVSTLTLAAYYFFYQPCDPGDTVRSRLFFFETHQGAEPTDEYTPTAADNDSLHPHTPPFWLSPNPDAAPPLNSTPGPAPRELVINSPISQQLILNLRQYPTWHVNLNGVEIPPEALTKTPRADGLINLAVQPGTVHLTLTNRPAPLEKYADILSTFAALLTFVLWKHQGSTALKALNYVHDDASS